MQVAQTAFSHNDRVLKQRSQEQENPSRFPAAVLIDFLWKPSTVHRMKFGKSEEWFGPATKEFLTSRARFLMGPRWVRSDGWICGKIKKAIDAKKTGWKTDKWMRLISARVNYTHSFIVRQRRKQSFSCYICKSARDWLGNLWLNVVRPILHAGCSCHAITKSFTVQQYWIWNTRDIFFIDNGFAFNSIHGNAYPS